MSIKTRATIEDLYKVEGKAELVHGEIVEMPPAGEDPNFAGGEVFASLRNYVRRTGHGRAFTAGAGFHVHLPHRDAFSPDAAYHVGPRMRMRFAEGAPIFAVEVRSANDDGPAAERALQEKRDDYFACGTLVVWDVDLLSADVVQVYALLTPTTRQSTGAGRLRRQNRPCRVADAGGYVIWVVSILVDMPLRWFTQTQLSEATGEYFHALNRYRPIGSAPAAVPDSGWACWRRADQGPKLVGIHWPLAPKPAHNPLLVNQEERRPGVEAFALPS